MVLFSRRLIFLLMLMAINRVWADDSFIIVTDPWPPYAYIDNGKAVGIDVDIALSVLSKLGIKGRIVMMPWKRSLLQVKAQKADAILSAAVTDYRKSFLHFPEEPVSSGDTVFFMRGDDEIVFQSLEGLEDLKVAAMLGYKYCPEFDNTNLLLSASRVATLEQSFNMLISKRVDLIVGVDAVGLYKAQEMGITNNIKVLKGSGFCTVENHLAFAKKSGYELRAQKFSQALKEFKTTEAYEEILMKYGVGAD